MKNWSLSNKTSHFKTEDEKILLFSGWIFTLRSLTHDRNMILYHSDHFCVNLWISKLSLESLGWQESEEEALFEQFGRSAERNWNTTELRCYCVCPISSHRAAAHKYSFSPRLSNRLHRCGQLTFFAQCIMAHQIYNIYTVKQWSPQCIFTRGGFIIQRGNFPYENLPK